LLDGRVCETAPKPDTDIADDTIEAAKRGVRVRDDVLTAFGIRDIADHHVRMCMFACD
jgi:hypothetical protein